MQFAFTRLPTVERADLCAEPVSEEPVLLVIPREHRLASAPAVTLRYLVDEDLIFIDRQVEPELHDYYVATCVNSPSGPGCPGACSTSSPPTARTRRPSAGSSPPGPWFARSAGGNSPFIVFDDADLEQAVSGIVSAKFRNAGQICTAANRILLQRGIAEEFTELLRRHADRVQVDHGGKVLTGGAPHQLGGTFYQPTVISGISQESAAWREETFGPVAALTVFDDESEAITMANDTEYGLVSYIYTHDVGRVFRVSEALEAGMVAVNTGRVSNEQAPSAASRSRASGARARSTASMTGWTSSTST
jgi:acyl-CoA reductase-like NAD-dependent aldehyde dehydrogenase